MITRREVLMGGAAAIVAAAIGRPAWAASAPASGGAAVAPPLASPFDKIIGESPPIVALRDALQALAERVRDSRAPGLVVIPGETGTGKELAAQVLHGASRTGPCLGLNPIALPEFLLESALLGYGPGAFTHPSEGPGIWEDACGGTVILDEAAFMPCAVWLKVARLLETRSLRRLGSTRGTPIDALTIMTASHSLDMPLGTRTFREGIAPLEPAILTVPPLRERGDDVQLLADHFLAGYCRTYGQPTRALTPAARRALAAGRWPGNVRQLANVIERAVLLSRGPRIDAADLAEV